MKPVLRGFGTAAMIALAFALPVSGQTLLRLAPPEGQVSRYVFSLEMTMENPMMPTSGPVITFRAHQTLTILSTAGDVIRGRTAIDSAAMTNAFPGAGPSPDLSGSVFAIDRDPRGRLIGSVAEDTPGGGAEQGDRRQRFRVRQTYGALEGGEVAAARGIGHGIQRHGAAVTDAGEDILHGHTTFAVLVGGKFFEFAPDQRAVGAETRR